MNEASLPADIEKQNAQIWDELGPRVGTNYEFALHKMSSIMINASPKDRLGMMALFNSEMFKNGVETRMLNK